MERWRSISRSDQAMPSRLAYQPAQNPKWIFVSPPHLYQHWYELGFSRITTGACAPFFVPSPVLFGPELGLGGYPQHLRKSAEDSRHFASLNDLSPPHFDPRGDNQRVERDGEWKFWSTTSLGGVAMIGSPRVGRSLYECSRRELPLAIMSRELRKTDAVASIDPSSGSLTATVQAESEATTRRPRSAGALGASGSASTGASSSPFAPL